MTLPPPTSSSSSDPGTWLLPPEPTFAGHQTFPLRASWLKKGFDALSAGEHGGAIFSRPEAIVSLGVGKNMTGAIRHWLVATGMAAEGSHVESRSALAPSDLGRRIFGQDGWDPYLEDEATLWILHARLCGVGSGAFSWVYAFNLLNKWEWTRDELTEAVREAAAVGGGKLPSRETVERDVTCLLQSYALSSAADEDWLSSPLRALRLVAQMDDKRMRFAVGEKPSLPGEVFAWALAEWWRARSGPNSKLIAANEICFAAGAPGRLFKLDEKAVFARLDALSDITGGALRLEDTEQMPQVVARDGVGAADSVSWLEDFYAHTSRAQSLEDLARRVLAQPESMTVAQGGTRS